MINYHHILLLPDDSTPIIHPRLFEIDPRPSINIKNSVSDVSTGDTFSLKETFSHIFIDAYPNGSGNGKRSPSAVHLEQPFIPPPPMTQLCATPSTLPRSVN